MRPIGILPTEGFAALQWRLLVIDAPRGRDSPEIGGLRGAVDGKSPIADWWFSRVLRMARGIFGVSELADKAPKGLPDVENPIARPGVRRIGRSRGKAQHGRCSAASPASEIFFPGRPLSGVNDDFVRTAHSWAVRIVLSCIPSACVSAHTKGATFPSPEGATLVLEGGN